MKKIISLIACSVLLSTAFAQLKSKKIHFGFKVGLNHTVINGVETNGNKTGFVGTSAYTGFFSEIPVGSTTLLQTEVLFTWINDWNFVEVPIHIKQTLSKHWSVFLGPKLDIAADRFDKTDGNTSGLVGISAESGVQFSITKKIFVESRYTIGISKQFRDVDFDINDGMRNNFRLGFVFRF